jgi:hypothetical protein
MVGTKKRTVQSNMKLEHKDVVKQRAVCALEVIQSSVSR